MTARGNDKPDNVARGWPALDFAADAGTIETCHLALQLIGKLPTRLHPWINHGWHVALRVAPHGFVTRTIPVGGGPSEHRAFTAELDVCDQCIRITCDDGTSRATDIGGKTIAALHGDLVSMLEDAGLPAPLHGHPDEIADAIPFAEDHRRREWDGETACRLHEAFLSADRVFTRFRSLYRGKSSPSHLFWGSFDLAVTRFSGREAPAHPGGVPGLSDAVTREAYSHEVISAGFWPGAGLGEAGFYAYAYPSPEALRRAAVSPADACWHDGLGEFVLPYAQVRGAADPDRALLDFLQSSYDAAADLLDWPAGLTMAGPSIGSPPGAGDG